MSQEKPPISTQERFENKQKACEYLVQKGLKTVEERFGENGTEEHLPFHQVGHSQMSVEYIQKILETLGASPTDVSLGRVVAAWHDSIVGGLADSSDDYERARWAIAGTFVEVKMEQYPDDEIERMKGVIDVGQNMGLHIYQPHVLKSVESGDIDEVEMALALADFGVYAMEEDSEKIFSATPF